MLHLKECKKVLTVVLLAYNGYQRRNRYDTWQFERAQGNYTLSQPTFSLYPVHDPVARWDLIATALGSSKYLTNHYNKTIETAHWPQEEQPEQYDAIFREWVGNVTFPSSKKN